jgi:hypothetical protein
MQTLVCTAEFCQKIINLKKAGMAGFVKNLVVMNDASPALLAEAEA